MRHAKRKRTTITGAVLEHLASSASADGGRYCPTAAPGVRGDIGKQPGGRHFLFGELVGGVGPVQGIVGAELASMPQGRHQGVRGYARLYGRREMCLRRPNFILNRSSGGRGRNIVAYGSAEVYDLLEPG